MAPNLTTQNLLIAAFEALAPISATPALDAAVLLTFALGGQRARLKSHADEERSDAECARYAELIARRAAGEPIAYIVGHKEFWSLHFGVSAAVLVPRPETELLVERALALMPTTAVRALDLGTGAGSIALALAHERREWHVTASDISSAALAVAARNAQALNLHQVEFVCGSWFEPLTGRRFDLIASNPPYVAAGDAALRAATMRHEPRIALTPGDDALADLRHIIRASPEYLPRGGWLLLEHGATQANEVARELVVRGFRHVRSRRDLAGHERMTEAQWGAQLPHEA
ncbi:MAG TPA: peptide chain release factor N(5)-glutamine methyltransferase [Steroidobacteraceae bacterium]